MKSGGVAFKARRGAGQAPLRIGVGLLILLSGLGLLALGGLFSRTLDLLTHATPLFGLAGLVLCGLSLARAPRAWVRASLGAASAVASLWLVWPELSAGRETTTPGAPTVTVLTQNLWASNSRPSETAAAIAAANADIVVLQEVRGRSFGVAAQLSSAYPYRANCAEKSEWCYMAILSRRPIKAWSYHVADWLPPNYDRLGLVRATIDGGTAGVFEVIGTHLIHPDPKGAGEEQAAQTVAAIADADPRRAIFVGDFNRVPWSFAMRKIDRGTALVRRTHGLATWPRRLPLADGGVAFPVPFLAIDQVFAGSSWKVSSIRRVSAGGSDHYGVLTTLVMGP